MKYRDIQDANIRKARHDYIDSRWRGLQSVVSLSLTRILNYLFVLNSGGLLAALTYIATKTKTEKLYFSIWCFVAGVIFITVHATWDYYSCERHFQNWRKDVDVFFKSEIDWEVMIDRDDRHGSAEWLLHILGWASGVAFMIGLCVGIYSV
jgi:hypothetical protein